MTAPEDFLKELQQAGISFFAGVPDSLMKGFLACVQKEVKDHFITANEGAAVAMASGYHIATGKTGLVYLQNSGLGNIINPLTSLADKNVYGIPMLLMLGWRGQPGKKDELQHKRMGATTLRLLEALEIPHFIFSKENKNWQLQLSDAIKLTGQNHHPIALVIEENFFEDRELVAGNDYELSAEEVLSSFLPALNENDIVVCTTGKVGRLFYSFNAQHKNKIRKYFLNVGAMGHASAVAAALAKFTKDRVVLFDGDGSLLMHLGSLAMSGTLEVNNLIYILLNNGAHQSVGGQPTLGFKIDFCGIARSCGFKETGLIITGEDLERWSSLPTAGKQFIEIRINLQMPENLPRPVENFSEAKESLMKALNSK